MGKKIFYIALITALVVGIGALIWWFFNRDTPDPTQTGSGFGSGQDTKQSGTVVSTDPTNVAIPTQNTAANKPPGNLSPGTYAFRSGNQALGTYTITPAESFGTYTVTSQGGTRVTPGRYTLAVPNTTTTYTVLVSPMGTSSDVYVITADQISGNIVDTIISTSTGPGRVGVEDVTWLSATTTNNRGNVFNPTGINNLNTDTPDGGVLPNIGGGGGGTGSRNGGLGLGGALVGAAVAGGISCGAAEAFAWVSKTAGELLGVSEAAPGEAISAAAVAEQIPLKAISVSTVDIGTTQAVLGVNTTLVALNKTLGGSSLQQKATDTTNTFWGCLARTVARIALNQITNSVVNWINSGFGADGGPGSGGPSFVTNPERFFTQLADRAAGEFIKGSSLSFLCSPFQLQIRIAIAKSYAQRNAYSCTLTSVTNNIRNFMDGNFRSGGWPAMLSFTTMPTNNPYGAFLYADASITYSVQTRQGEQRRQLSLGNGFFDFKQKKNCRNTPTRETSSASRSVREVGDPEGGASYEVCDLITTTPGNVIAQNLGATQSSTLDQLSLAKSFDEIIGALISQLLTRTLQGGLLNLSGHDGYESNFYSSEELAAQRSAQDFLSQLQNDNSVAQTLGSIKQGSIQDIQNTQRQVNELGNCWLNAPAGPQTTASALAASSTIASLNTKVDFYNNQILEINEIITTLVTLQSRTLSAGSMSDLDAIKNARAAAQAQGRLVTQADITTAQQDRTTLQSQLASINQQTTTGLIQCNAIR